MKKYTSEVSPDRKGIITSGLKGGFKKQAEWTKTDRFTCNNP